MRMTGMCAWLVCFVLVCHQTFTHQMPIHDKNEILEGFLMGHTLMNGIKAAKYSDVFFAGINIYLNTK